MTINEIARDVENIRITEFMEAIGEKPVEKNGNILTYNAPYNIEELLNEGIVTAGKPTCLVDTERNLWRDSNYTPWQPLIMLALEWTWLYSEGRLRHIIAENIYALRKSKEKSGLNTAGKSQEPVVIKLDVPKLPLTEFMKALGQEHPVAADGNLRIYNAPYDSPSGATLVINTETNLWRDTKTGANGGIYDLAYELTGSCNKRELNLYIAGQMGEFDKRKVGQEQKQQAELPKQEPKTPKRKMRF